MTISTKVFVYGTLMKGFGNRELIEDYIQGYSEAKVRGELYNLGAFPGMIKPSSVTSIQGVEGEVLTFLDEDKEEVLRILDRLEGHPNYYKREKIKVFYSIDSKPTKTIRSEKVWTYIFQGPTSEERMIKSGNWKTFSERRTNYASK